MNTSTVIGSYENLDSSRFQQKLATTSDAILLDVRTEAEFESERIPNSINMNVMDASFMEKISSLDKNKTYFVYCRSGGRSGSACSIMSKQGYEVYNLAGGISNWTGEIIN
jgi:rhodanese-related sulfurtransferase